MASTVAGQGRNTRRWMDSEPSIDEATKTIGPAELRF